MVKPDGQGSNLTKLYISITEEERFFPSAAHPFFSEIRSLYTRLRFCRSWNDACRRRWYRRIRKSKLRLLEAGVDPEQLRLYCRYLKNPKDEARRQRYLYYAKQLRLF